MTEVSHHAYNPCHVCTGEDFSWGFVTVKGAKVDVVFSYEKSPLDSMRGFAGRTLGTTIVEGELVARRCNLCGNVQMFSIVDAHRKKKR